MSSKESLWGEYLTRLCEKSIGGLGSKLFRFTLVSMGAVRMCHGIREFATQPVILWILLGGKPKWLLLNFGFNDVMRTAPIALAHRC